VTGAGTVGRGTELASLTFELSYSHVITRASKVIRIDPDQAAALGAQAAGRGEVRPLRPNDPLYFESDADEPQPMSSRGGQCGNHSRGTTSS